MKDGLLSEWRRKIGSWKLFFYFLLFTFYFLLLSSCKAKKNLPPQNSRCRLDYKSARTLVTLLKQNQVEYTTFNGKIKANVVIDEKGTEFSVSLRMKKDSIIWASVSSFGIEGIRFVATKDTLKFIDRLNNKYFVGEYDTLSKMLNTEIDLEVLQSLLVGNSVEFYMEDEKLRGGIDSCRYILGTIRKRKLRKVIRGKELKDPAQNIWMIDSTFKISRILFREFDSRREFDAQFQNFQPMDLPEGASKQVIIPYGLTYYIKTNSVIRVDFEYTKASVDKPQTFPFSIPEGYERIELKNGK
ncbi:MAG: DUF4292 domain-containing protein [Bacteroidetes bacterium]|nr:DUF4292 domain-containing protein [Bacteroidota bacterium]